MSRFHWDHQELGRVLHDSLSYLSHWKCLLVEQGLLIQMRFLWKFLTSMAIFETFFSLFFFFFSFSLVLERWQWFSLAVPFILPPEGSCQFNFQCTDRQLTKAGALQQARGQGLSTQLQPSSLPPYSSSCQGGTSPSCLASPHLLQLWLPESWSRVRTCKSNFLTPQKKRNFRI